MKETKQINVIPNGKRVLVKLEPQEKISKGGILLVTQSDKKQDKGTIVAVGAELEGEYWKAGQRIICDKFGGTDISFAGEDYVMIDEKEVIAFVEVE